MSRNYEGIPRRWADFNEGRASPRAKGSGEGKRVSFSGRVYFSYQTPVATYASNARGEKCVLVAGGKWSVSTGQHIQAAKWAASVPIFAVDLIGEYGGWTRGQYSSADDLHPRNAAQLVQKAHDTFNGYWKRWRRAESYGAEWMVGYVERAYVAVVEYCTFWDIPIPDGNVAAADAVSRLREGWAAQKARYEDPKAVAKRERARARALAKQVLCGEDA